jgi:hypothetical protein
MVHKFSKNGVAVVLFILSFFGLNVAEAEAAEFVSAIGTIISFGLMLWNQFDRRDVSWFIFKK